jgi:hypothetical protein
MPDPGLDPREHRRALGGEEQGNSPTPAEVVAALNLIGKESARLGEEMTRRATRPLSALSPALLAAAAELSEVTMEDVRRPEQRAALAARVVLAYLGGLTSELTT